MEKTIDPKKPRRVHKLTQLLLAAVCFGGLALSARPAHATYRGVMRMLGKCMTVPNYQSGNGTPVELQDCNGGTNQLWFFAANGSVRPWFNLAKCLDLPDWQTANGTQLEIWDCNDGSNQYWSFQHDSIGLGTLQGYGNKCVDDPNWSEVNGTIFDYWDCNGGTNQQFLFEAQ